MSIINQMYSKIITKSLENSLKAEIKLSSVDNYLDFINYLDGFLLKIVKKSIVSSFESIGVANPSDLKRDLKLPIFNDRFDLQINSVLLTQPIFWKLLKLLLRWKNSCRHLLSSSLIRQI